MLNNVTTNASRDMSGSSAWSDSAPRAKAGVFVQRNLSGPGSLSLNTWARLSVNKSLGQLIRSHHRQKVNKLLQNVSYFNLEINNGMNLIYHPCSFYIFQEPYDGAVLLPQWQLLSEPG